NKAANRALLASLGIERPLFQAPAPIKKRKKLAVVVEPSRKSARISEDKKSPHYGYVEFPESDSEDGGAKTRRNKRARTKKTAKMGPTRTDADALIPTYVNERNAHRLNPKRFRPDPKQHGEIPGVKVGHWWETRMECSADGVHAPPVSGISGSGNGSAYSIALSGGYEDDVDEGFRFTFTGSGGRNLSGTAKNPKNLRTAPQSSDQQLVGGNLALSNSCESGLPVRVIRGYKATLGPPEGYRYDGLYKVVKAWSDVGMSGYKVWRFAFMRVDGQEPVD
ncbi:PUA-like domain-containing protein, partial [Morchella snyderi]